MAGARWWPVGRSVGDRHVRRWMIKAARLTARLQRTITAVPDVDADYVIQPVPLQGLLLPSNAAAPAGHAESVAAGGSCLYGDGTDPVGRRTDGLALICYPPSSISVSKSTLANTARADWLAGYLSRRRYVADILCFGVTCCCQDTGLDTARRQVGAVFMNYSVIQLNGTATWTKYSFD